MSEDNKTMSGISVATNGYTPLEQQPKLLDSLHNEIEVGDIVKVSNYDGIWKAPVVMHWGTPCVDAYEAEQIENPDRWGKDKSYDCVRSSGFLIFQYQPLLSFFRHGNIIEVVMKELDDE